MPKGPNGEKRPADAIGLAVMVGRIATGEVEDVALSDGKDNRTPTKAVLEPSNVARPNRQKPS